MTAEPLVPLELGLGTHSALLGGYYHNCCICADACILGRCSLLHSISCSTRPRDVVAEYLTEEAAAWP